MPAGLDGNPDPLVTPERTRVLQAVAQVILDTRLPGTTLLVAVDGIDGSGKSTFADELAGVLRDGGAQVVRSTVDSFHNPREVRYAKGPESPAGFFLDSHNLTALKHELLDPFVRGSGTYVTEVFDSRTDNAVASSPKQLSGGEVLLFDGIFTHRDELRDYWDFTIFLDAQQRVDLSRLGHVLKEVPTEPIQVVSHVLDWAQKMDRYSSGMRYYLDSVDPIRSADVVIDNNDLARPRLHHTIEIYHEIEIQATAEHVYSLVSDVTRIGEYSPECVRCEWISGEPGAVGSQFLGSNYERNSETGQEWSWDMTSQVVEADAPHTFAWSVLTEAWDLDTSVWRFTVVDHGDHVVLQQRYRMKRPPQGWQPILDRHGWTKQVELVQARGARLDRGMQATLQAIANVATQSVS